MSLLLDIVVLGVLLIAMGQQGSKELVVTYAVIKPVPTTTKVMDAEDAA